MAMVKPMVKPQFLLVGLFGNSQPVKQTALKNKSKNSALSTPSKKGLTFPQSQHRTRPKLL
jgi:hypothetical protein